MPHKRWANVLLSTVALLVWGSNAVVALTRTAAGDRIKIVALAETAKTSVNRTSFTNLPGAIVSVAVPSGASRQVIARFMAETNCAAPPEAAGDNCNVRIVAVRSDGAALELNPASGQDFGFDSVLSGGTSDYEETQVVERSTRLAGGFYRIRVQLAVADPAVTFQVDDWHFIVEVNE